MIARTDSLISLAQAHRHTRPRLPRAHALACCRKWDLFLEVVMTKPKLLVFASGSAHGGGSGFENLVLKSRDGSLDANIVAVVSNHEHGGVRQKADALLVPFIHFPRPWSPERYRALVAETGVEFSALSGWLKLVKGLDSRTTFNIHPGPLPMFGGSGMYGQTVHEAVLDAFALGIITHTEVCMHFVTQAYDDGPCFFRHRIHLSEQDTVAMIAARVHRCEHKWQPKITNLVVHREITWDGRDPLSLRLPSGYAIEHS